MFPVLINKNFMLNKVCFTLIMMAFIIPFLNGVITPKAPVEMLDEGTLKILDNCAEQNTRFLQGKISEETIKRFRDYCSKTFCDSPELPIAFFSFIPLRGWSAKKITHINHSYRVQALLRWLKNNYTPTTTLQFFYLANEPYCEGYRTHQKIQNTLSELLSSCPLLISCTHPDLVWTKKAILIPDDYILAENFNKKMKALLNAPLYTSHQDLLASTQKGLVSFSERIPHVYFRGILTGPKVPLSMENMPKNPRHYILTLLKDFPYLDIGITNFNNYNTDDAYFVYLKKTYAHLLCSPVDFFEHAKNKYLLSCDGFGASWSRIQLIMATGSVLFLNAQCEQYFYPLMENYKTHVVINRDFSNFDAEFKRLESAPEIAQEIGEEGKKFAQKFFTKEAIDSYLWLVLNKVEKCSATLQD